MTARKHDGFRILARKDGNPVKLITRNGYDFADRFPLIVDGIASLPMETCIIDGEATVVDQNGLLVFDAISASFLSERGFGICSTVDSCNSGAAVRQLSCSAPLGRSGISIPGYSISQRAQKPQRIEIAGEFLASCMPL
jgi:hypothetical protein